MNIYFLVEGKKTEALVYPKLISFFIPELSQVENYNLVDTNSYYLFNSGGYPCILNDMNNAIKDINEIGKYDLLVVCLDSDGKSVNDVREEVITSMKEALVNCEIKVIVQAICFETWFLGNRRVVKRNPSEVFKEHLDFYDVRIDEPEIMTKPESFRDSESQYHSMYLKKMLLERRITYTKARPLSVATDTYISELCSRIEDTDHLKSFKEFVNLCNEIKFKL